MTDAGFQANKEVHDGVVLMKDNSKFWKKAWSQFKSTFLSNISAKEEQQTLGVRAMFPNWIKELKKGRTVEDLFNWIVDVKRQQCERISGFPKYTNTYTTNYIYLTGERLIDKVTFYCNFC